MASPRRTIKARVPVESNPKTPRVCDDCECPWLADLGSTATTCVRCSCEADDTPYCECVDCEMTIVNPSPEQVFAGEDDKGMGGDWRCEKCRVPVEEAHRELVGALQSVVLAKSVKWAFEFHKSTKTEPSSWTAYRVGDGFVYKVGHYIDHAGQPWPSCWYSGLSLSYPGTADHREGRNGKGKGAPLLPETGLPEALRPSWEAFKARLA